ncbi:MAG TPA: hypothetical protein VLT85_00810, partial [Terriglobales bacterium]|nr:hypothetical protein [Terriglobales bacterium]
EKNARPEAFPHNPCYPHGVQQGGVCVPCASGQVATIANSCVSPPERERLDHCLLEPWSPECSRPSSVTPARDCDWLLRQVEQGEFDLAQVANRRDAACGQDPTSTECQNLAAQYPQLLQRVRQDQAAYNRCQAGHP